MDTFNIPGWESNKIGDRNANELCNNRKQLTISKKSKSKRSAAGGNKKKSKFGKKLEINFKHSSVAPSNVVKVNAHSPKISQTFKNKNKAKAIPILHGGKREIISAKRNSPNNKKLNSTVQIPKGPENIIQKRNVKRSKKKNKLLENETISINKNQAKEQIPEKKSEDDNTNSKISKKLSRKDKLISLLSKTPMIRNKQGNSMSLKERMMEKLKASRFRYINEQIYNSESKEAQQYFKKDPDAFSAYHEGYRQQVSKWPLNPVDVIIKSVKKMSADYVIADLGCGEAKLAKSVPQTVHSFDLVAVNEYITACDMSKVQLENESVDVAIFCLSLMGSNIKEYLFEANRILKIGGLLKVAEVESRFDTVDVFIEGVKRFGFVNTWKDLSHNLFYFLDFKKTAKSKSLNKLPTISLHPCLYKKR